MLVVIVTIAIARVMIICDNHKYKNSRINNNNNNKHIVNNNIFLDNPIGNDLDINHYYYAYNVTYLHYIFLTL